MKRDGSVQSPAALVAEPGQVKLASTGGKTTLQLQNPGGVKMMFKVKCTNNNEYRVNPVYGFIEAGAKAPVEVIRLAGPPKDDKLVVHFAPAPAGATDAQAAFKSATPTGNVTINLSAT